MDIEKVHEEQRKHFFTNNFDVHEKKVFMMDMLETEKSSAKEKGIDTSEFEIAFSFHKDDDAAAMFLDKLLKKKLPNISSNYGLESATDRLKSLDTVKLIVTLLSPSYFNSPEHMEEFHVALCRERFSKKKVLYPIHMFNLPTLPTFLHLIPCDISLADSFWKDWVKSLAVGLKFLNFASEDVLDIHQEMTNLNRSGV